MAPRFWLGLLGIDEDYRLTSNSRRLSRLTRTPQGWPHKSLAAVWALHFGCDSLLMFEIVSWQRTYSTQWDRKSTRWRCLFKVLCVLWDISHHQNIYNSHGLIICSLLDITENRLGCSMVMYVCYSAPFPHVWLACRELNCLSVSTYS